MHKNNSTQSGFTIVELMISTVIFSMVLLLLTTGVIGFTKSYYKGITSTNTQRVARVISDDITQTIQSSSQVPYFFKPLPTPDGYGGFCVGNVSYAYHLGYELVNGTPDSKLAQTNQSLLKNTSFACSSEPDAKTLYTDLAKPGSLSQEMLSPSMRIADLEVAQINPPDSIVYSVRLTVAYGDDDLLNDPTSTSPSCAPVSGSQFCAVSSLGTVVRKLINQ